MSLCQDLATDRAVGELQAVATFSGPMPTGVTVANDGRIFVNFPKWGDNVEYTVAEVKAGKTLPYPNADINHYKNSDNQAEKLVSVQSVVVDPGGARLWILDTGSIGFGPTSVGGPKLIAVDLKTDKIIKKIIFPADVALPTTYLNDVRFDLHRGTAGMAFITDSSSNGPDGIIVVDLSSGKSWRRLNDHPSTKPDPGLFPWWREKFSRFGFRGNRPRGSRSAPMELQLAPMGKRFTIVRCPVGISTA